MSNTDNIKIQKPITMLKKEFEESLSNLINNAVIPPFMVEYALSTALSQVHNFALEYERMEKENYEKELAEQTTAPKNKGDA